MSTKQLFAILSLFTLIVLITACGATTQAAGDEHHAGEEIDHEHAEAPAEFDGLTNPLAGDAAAVTAGQVIYETNCATCHGQTGHGDGPAAESLDPKPASLANAAMMNEMTDGYLFWRVSKGGQMDPFNSAMPAWGKTLTDKQIWQAISYVRTLSNGQTEMHGTDEHHEDVGAEHDEHHEDVGTEHDEHHEDSAN